MTSLAHYVCFLCALGASTAVAAEESSLDFFDRDAALSVFDDSIVVVNAGRLKERTKEKRKSNPRVVEAGEENENTAKAKDGGSSFDPKNTSEDDIVAEFGEPDEKLPMMAVESAPKPFKAMLRALESGHDDLAFQYARQYVRYVGHIQSQNARVMSLTGKALEREGMAESGQWEGGPDFVEDQQILERDLKRSGIGTQSAGLDDRTRDLVAEAQAAEKRADARNAPGGENSIIPSMTDDVATQALINNEGSAGAVKQNRSAQPVKTARQPTEVLFFFAPNDSAALEMAPEVESLHRAGLGVTVVGYTVGPFNLGEAQRFKSRTGTTFLIRDGANLSQLMQIKGSPTVVVSNPRTGKVVNRQGILRFGEMEQIVKSLDTGR